METRSTRLRKFAVLLLTAVLVIFSTAVFSIQFTQAAAGDNEENGDKPEITIEVVEDIPAAEMEEEKVPLADSPYTAAAGNTRSTVISWTLGAILIAYMVFLISGMSRRKNRRRMQAGTAGDRGSGTGGEVTK